MTDCSREWIKRRKCESVGRPSTRFRFGLDLPWLPFAFCLLPEPPPERLLMSERDLSHGTPMELHRTEHTFNSSNADERF